MKVACRHRFPSVEDGGFQFLSQHQLVQQSFPYPMVWTRSWNCRDSLPITDIPILSFPNVPEQEEQNWIISRKCWNRNKISGNKSILKICSMPYESIGNSKICEFPFWPPLSCCKLSGYCFSEERSPFIRAHV